MDLWDIVQIQWDVRLCSSIAVLVRISYRHRYILLPLLLLEYS